MTRRIRNSALVVAGVWLATALGSVQAVSQSEAEAIAARTGEIIGGASVCGVAEGELIALGAKVIRWAIAKTASVNPTKRFKPCSAPCVKAISLSLPNS